ncbi:MAG: cytochrome biosis protein transrane region [Candidatus Saccharibacteria bacterium]|nr:cytochrome biosis protein transrane region [Candidatus Saccharibacteria bacterium]
MDLNGFFVASAFFAGIITVFAPCVFALLPVIIGGSMSGDVHDKRRPFIIAGSLAVSLIVFTLLLKVTTLFINIPPSVITTTSGIIIVLLGLALLFPNFYDKIIIALNLQARSQRLLGKGSTSKGAVIGAVITGAALGPVFSSCSPVYGYILATVLPVHFGVAMVYIIAYVIGLSAMLLLVGFLGQKFVRKLRWASNPRGLFTRIVSVLFIIVGLLIITGYDKKFQTFVADHTALNFDGISSQLIPKGKNAEQTNDLLNVAKPYAAPELTGISTWINSEPKTIASLKGKVVLIDFWTYSCINCIRTQPYLRDLYSKYHDAGLEIIGVHAPEFSFEKNPDNVRNAVKEAGLKYPIAMDNDLLTWSAYNNQYWPASYLIDKDGQIRRTHFGEGQYAENEQAIRQLLAEQGGKVPDVKVTSDSEAMDQSKLTPETYLGTERAAGYVGDTRLIIGTQSYTPKKLESVSEWTLGGTWTVASDGITAVQDSVLRYRVSAKDVYLVTGSNAMGTIDVSVNDKSVSTTKFAGSDIKNSQLNVSMAQLYKIVNFGSYNSDATVELHVPAGVQLNTFTFGG